MYNKINVSAITGIVLLLSFFGGPVFGQTDSGKAAKNVILMIGDGMGFNAVELGRLYQKSLAVAENQLPFYDDPSKFPVYLGVTTFMLDSDPKTNLDPDKAYNPDYYWEKGTTVNQRLQPEIGSGAKTTMSDAASTAIHTGEKTTSGRISVDAYGKTLQTIAEIASAEGKKTGTASTVPLTHATPAAVGAHNVSRYNYGDIFEQMLTNLDVMIGTGNPNAPGGNTGYVGNQSWPGLRDGTLEGYTLVEQRTDFESLADGTKTISLENNKVVGMFETFDSIALNDSNIPSLSTISLATLNLLNQGDNGFFAMIEGGGIDWRAEANNTRDTAQQQAAFAQAVNDVWNWINVNQMWEDTLLIVTADHETGDLWGPEGLGSHVVLPQDGTNVWGISGNHSNAIVPLWAAGAGSGLFANFETGYDPFAEEFWSELQGSRSFSGNYIDNTDIFNAMKEAMLRPSAAVPEPSTLLILGLAGLAAAPTIRKRIVKTGKRERF